MQLSSVNNHNFLKNFLLSPLGCNSEFFSAHWNPDCPIPRWNSRIRHFAVAREMRANGDKRLHTPCKLRERRQATVSRACHVLSRQRTRRILRAVPCPVFYETSNISEIDWRVVRAQKTKDELKQFCLISKGFVTEVRARGKNNAQQTERELNQIWNGVWWWWWITLPILLQNRRNPSKSLLTLPQTTLIS